MTEINQESAAEEAYRFRLAVSTAVNHTISNIADWLSLRADAARAQVISAAQLDTRSIEALRLEAEAVRLRQVWNEQAPDLVAEVLGGRAELPQDSHLFEAMFEICKDAIPVRTKPLNPKSINDQFYGVFLKNPKNVGGTSNER